MIKTLQQFLRKILFCIISSVVPKQGRRLLFIAMCYTSWSKLKNEKKLKQELERLNYELNLTEDKEVFNFYLALNHILDGWDGWDGFDKLQTTDASTLESKLKNLPEWLQYSTIEKMKEDINMTASFLHTRLV